MSAYYEVVNAQPFDPAEIFTSCIESGAPALLLDEAALPAAQRACMGLETRLFRIAALWLSTRGWGLLRRGTA